ncbi:MAG: hypothetical protein KJ727_06550 [Acidobacteria bacterium]|nr:hypothetical protein [Acidobacteriota bacterium]
MQENMQSTAGTDILPDLRIAAAGAAQSHFYNNFSLSADKIDQYDFPVFLLSGSGTGE